jgi:hypothetical protein
MNIIIPAAGSSSRFPSVRPKWMLTHPNGNLMLGEALKGIDTTQVDLIYITVLLDHLDRYDCRDGIIDQFHQLGLGDKLQIVELTAPTCSQPETVAKTIELTGMKGPFTIKDTDNYFRLPPSSGNYVSVVDLNTSGMINAANKSYVTINENRIVTNIVEKKVNSNFFCCGAYGFESAEEYISLYNELSAQNDLYVSHIIYKMLLQNKAFLAVVCSDYEDWGTLKDWNRYKEQFGTIFIDLDGVLVGNSGEFFHPVWGETEGISENIKSINRLHASGKVQVIITTARKELYRERTIKQLERYGINYDQIIFGLMHGQRIIINDYAKTNPYKSCDAINIARNSAELGDMLESVFSIE